MTINDCSENGLGDEGAASIAASLGALQQLRDLDMSKNAIGREGCLAVARAAARLPALRALVLRWKEPENAVDELTKATVVQLLPRLTAGNLLL